MANRRRTRKNGGRRRHPRPLRSLVRSYRKHRRKSRCCGKTRKRCKQMVTCNWVSKGKNKYCRKTRNRRHRRHRRVGRPTKY